MTPQEQNIVANLALQSMQDANIRNALLSDPIGTLRQHGLNIPPTATAFKVVAVEDTATLFNLVVPTVPLQSNLQVTQLPTNPTPFAIATWIITNVQQKTPLASSLASDPVPVLQQMGVNIPSGVQIKVWQETSNTRYMVLPYFGSPASIPAQLQGKVALDKDTVNVNTAVNVNAEVTVNAVAIVNAAVLAAVAVESAVGASSAVVATEVVVVLII